MIISVPVSKNRFQSLAPMSDKVTDPFLCETLLSSASVALLVDVAVSDVKLSEYPEVLEVEYVWNSEPFSVEMTAGGVYALKYFRFVRCFGSEKLEA